MEKLNREHFEASLKAHCLGYKVIAGVSSSLVKVWDMLRLRDMDMLDVEPIVVYQRKFRSSNFRLY